MRVFLEPGSLYISDRPVRVSTILGSCIAVTMFSDRLKVGGICHALLPRNTTADGLNGFRYVDSSIAYMLKQFDHMGVDRHEMDVKLLGGANVLNNREDGRASVGQRNIDTALEIMKNENIRLSVSDIGGKQGRKIHFFTHTGKVLLARIRALSADGAGRPQNARLRSGPSSGE